MRQSPEDGGLDKTIKTTTTVIESSKGHVPFGEWKRQNIVLETFNSTIAKYETVINVTSQNVLSKRMGVLGCGEENRRYDFKQTNLVLPSDTAFISKVTVENDIQLCGEYVMHIIAFVCLFFIFYATLFIL